MVNKIEYSASRLKRLLRERAKPQRADSAQRFSKEPIRPLGVSTPEVRKLATAAAKEYRRARLSFTEILEIADALWRSAYFEDRVLAIEIARRFKRHLGREHWKRFDGWVDSMSNWAEIDNVDRLSRTTVRYACEKLPSKLRKRVMSA